MSADEISLQSGKEGAGQITRWWREAETAMRRGQSARARRFLRWILAVCPEEEEAWLWLARLATDQGERIDSLRRVYALHPDSPRVVAALREARLLQLESAVGKLPRRTVLLRCLPDRRCKEQQKAPTRLGCSGRR